jgi:nitrilase
VHGSHRAQGLVKAVQQRSQAAQPAFGEQAALLADIDLDVIDGANLDLDVVGHYARPDLFRLTQVERPARR